jgi:transposase
MRKKYRGTLIPEERARLRRLISSGKTKARKLTRARILLKADEAEGRPGWDDRAISEALDVGLSTIYRIRKRFVEEGLEAALEQRRPRRVYRRKLDGEGEAHLIALACSSPPEGRERWTLRLLADRMVELGDVEEISYQTVRRVLKKTSSSHG